MACLLGWLVHTRTSFPCCSCWHTTLPTGLGREIWPTSSSVETQTLLQTSMGGSAVKSTSVWIGWRQITYKSLISPWRSCWCYLLRQWAVHLGESVMCTSLMYLWSTKWHPPGPCCSLYPIPEGGFLPPWGIDTHNDTTPVWYKVMPYIQRDQLYLEEIRISTVIEKTTICSM